MRIKANLSIGYANADHEEKLEIEDDELEGKDEYERDDYIMGVVGEWANNYIDMGYEVIEE